MLETSSKSSHNWRRYPSSKCYETDENVRFRIRRSAMAPSDNLREKPQYGCTTAVPHVHNSPKEILETLLFTVWLLVRTILFVPSHFGLPIRGVRVEHFSYPTVPVPDDAYPYPYPTRSENCYPTRPDPRVYPYP